MALAVALGDPVLEAPQQTTGKRKNIHIAMRHFDKVLAVMCILFLAGMLCTSSTSLAQSGDESGTVVVKMVDRGGGQWRFAPANISVQKGDVVRFVQADIVPHNVEFKDTPKGTKLGDAAMGPFLMAKGETYEVEIDHRFAEGLHEYVCTPHVPMGMKGTITVERPASTRSSK